MVATLRVVFFGTPQFAVPSLQALLASRHGVCGVVTQPDRPRGRGNKVTEGPVKALARAHGLPIAQPTTLRDATVEATLRDWAPDLGVVVAYGQLIPASLLAVPRLGLINVHASLLPRYRGAAPIHRAVINGDTLTGVTIMRVAQRLDAGAMFATATRAIAPHETSEVVERDLSHLGAGLLLDVVERLAEGAATETAQDESLATYAHKLTKAEGAMDWMLPATALHNRVRGLQPWPHAFTRVNGARVLVLESAPVSLHSPAPPGTVVQAGPDALHVAAGEGTALALLRVQPEGRRAMSARDFLAGTPLSVGQLLSSTCRPRRASRPTMP
ncbi:MAG TPA: methionyl-tRNA formyltransferase [Vicinamibacterales bacterium]